MDIVTGPIAELGKLSIPLCLRHLGYLVHYNRNITELRNQMARLGDLKTDVQQFVDVTQSRGEVIKEVVKEWLARVDATQSEVMALYNAIQENKGCLQGGCRARYHVGKEAARKIDVVNNLQREGQFDAVSIPPPPPQGIEFMPTLDFQVYEPTNLAMKQITEALEDKKSNFIGIYGMGGVGKTTLIKEMAKELKSKGLFDRVVMVTVSQNPILKEIQREIAENLGLKIEEDSTSVRARRLLERMKQEKRILIILDDVWEPLPLIEVGIPFGDKDKEGNDGRGCNCNIMITTRYLEVCNQMGSQYNVEVKPLGEEDAWQLFRMSAGDRVGSPELHEVAREIVERCGGLPVALVTVGRALRDKDQKVWLDAATQLKKSIPWTIPGMQPRVLSSIKLSYDYLENEETRHCFLLCCLFPEDYIIYEDDLFPYVWGEKVFKDIETLNETRNRLHTVLDTLKRSCLLLSADKGHDKDFPEREGVKMHDIIRDVAIWIASQEHGFVVRAGRGLMAWPDMENLRNCKRLSLMKNEIKKLPEQMGCFQLMTLSLQNNNQFLEIPNGCFEGMTKLIVLDLRQTEILSMPVSLSWLTELLVFQISGYRSIFFPECVLDLSLLGNLKKLEILNLQECSIRTLPEEIGGLTNLKSLNLARNYDLIIPPKFLLRLSRMEELNLFYSFDEWEAEGLEDTSSACLSEVASLARLTKLWLNVSNVECLSYFISLHCDNLMDFFIVMGNCREKIFETEFISKRYASKMIFYSLTIPELSKWVEGLLGRTEEILLQDCGGPKNIFPSLGGGGSLNNLRSITVDECKDLEHIVCAEEEEEILINAFNTLEELTLYDVPDLREIWHGPFLKGSLENLRHLYISDCDRLNHIFQMNMVQGLPQLEEIKIQCCFALEEIVVKNEGESVASKVEVMFPRLRFLQLVELPNLSTVCQGVVSLRYDFPVIQRLCIYECPNLKRLPLSLGSTPRLREIEVEETWLNGLEWDEEPSDKLHLQERVKVKFLSEPPRWYPWCPSL